MEGCELATTGLLNATKASPYSPGSAYQFNRQFALNSRSMFFANTEAKCGGYLLQKRKWCFSNISHQSGGFMIIAHFARVRHPTLVAFILSRPGPFVSMARPRRRSQGDLVAMAINEGGCGAAPRDVPARRGRHLTGDDMAGRCLGIVL